MHPALSTVLALFGASALVALLFRFGPRFLRGAERDRPGEIAFRDDLPDRRSRAPRLERVLRPIRPLATDDPLAPLLGAPIAFPPDPDAGPQDLEHHLVIDPSELGPGRPASTRSQPIIDAE